MDNILYMSNIHQKLAPSMAEGLEIKKNNMTMASMGNSGLQSMNDTDWIGCAALFGSVCISASAYPWCTFMSPSA